MRHQEKVAIASTTPQTGWLFKCPLNRLACARENESWLSRFKAASMTIYCEVATMPRATCIWSCISRTARCSNYRSRWRN